MKSKHYILIAILVIIGQLIYMFWPDNNEGFTILVRSLTIVFAIKLTGDLLGRFVFKIPGHNWVYFRDYLQNELLSNLGFYVIFIVVWIVPSIYLMFWGSSSSIIAKIWNGGLVPSLLYMILLSNSLVEKNSTTRKLKRKI